MSIEFECDCGKKLRVKDELARRRIRCPDCDASLVVPGAETDEDEPPRSARARARVVEDDDEPPRGSRRPAKARVVDDDDEDDDRPRKRRRRDEDDDDYEPRARKKKRSAPVEDTSLSARAPIAVGCLMMLGAVVWFVLGLFADRIFFYPPILFVLGIISVGKGLMSK